MIHNHGTEEGEGLGCPELLLPDGSLKGACMDKAEEGWFERAYDKYVDEIYNDGSVGMTREEFRTMWDEVKDGFEFEKDSGSLGEQTTT